MSGPGLGFLSSAEWANAHGVSERRARQLAAAGQISARKLGGRWLIDDARRGGPLRGQRGRPLSERSAWAILDVLDGALPMGISRSELARARRRAAAAAALLPDELARRADVLPLRAHPGVLDTLSSDARVIVGGARAASVHGADLIGLSGIELYALRDDAAGLIGEYALRPARDDANVVLRVASRLPASLSRMASPAVAALDLLDAGDERSMRAARLLLQGMGARVRLDEVR
jgi:hypothetical protein